MYAEFITLAGRRALLQKALAVVAAGAACGAQLPQSDARLLAACGAFNELERQKQRLLKGGCEEDRTLEVRITQCIGFQEDHLGEMCAARAVTMAGNRARALSYALWDAGELSYRARVGGATEDMILDAMVRDLTEGNPSP